MSEEYIKQLEKRIEELQDIVSSFNPTTLNLLTILIQEKEKFIKSKNIKWDYQGMSHKMMLMELCTIKFNLGRQSGHTSALISIYNRSPNTTTLVFQTRFVAQLHKVGTYLENFEKNGSSLTSKLILCDNFLGALKTSTYEQNIYDVICSRAVINNGYPPIIIMT